MTPPPQICYDGKCPHKRRPLSLDYFRKGDSPPECYTYFRRCSDCRKTSTIPLPTHLPPAKTARQYCKKCHRLWSLTRFPNQTNKYCMFCSSTMAFYTTLLILSRAVMGSEQVEAGFE